MKKAVAGDRRRREADQKQLGNDPDITAAAKLAVCRWIRAQVDEWEAEAKAELSDSILPGDRQPAVLAGHVVGIISMRPGQRRLNVIDDEGLAEWVAERWPDQVEYVMQVLPAFKKRLKDRAVDGVLIDDDGEVCQWAESVQGEPTLAWERRPGDPANPDLDTIGGVVLELLQDGYSIDSIIRELPQGTTTEVENYPPRRPRPDALTIASRRPKPSETRRAHDRDPKTEAQWVAWENSQPPRPRPDAPETRRTRKRELPQETNGTRRARNLEALARRPNW
jgi:hypothetical protein